MRYLYLEQRGRKTAACLGVGGAPGPHPLLGVGADLVLALRWSPVSDSWLIESCPRHTEPLRPQSQSPGLRGWAEGRGEGDGDWISALPLPSELIPLRGVMNV